MAFMQPGIFERTANLLCETAKLNSGYYSAEDLRALVAAWPDPDKALAMMGKDAEELPIIFVDVPFEFVGKWMLELMESGTAIWPIAWMPLDRVNDWHEDGDAKTFRGYLQANRMGLGYGDGPEGTIRGYRVRMMDFRLMFLAGYSYASRTD